MSNIDAVTTKTARDQRLNFRASAQQQQLIRQAAEATDSTVTDFILGSVLESAERVLADRKWFVASEKQWIEFQTLLDAPLAPMPKLDRLLRREGAQSLLAGVRAAHQHRVPGPPRLRRGLGRRRLEDAGERADRQRLVALRGRRLRREEGDGAQ